MLKFACVIYTQAFDNNQFNSTGFNLECNWLAKMLCKYCFGLELEDKACYSAKLTLSNDVTPEDPYCLTGDVCRSHRNSKRLYSRQIKGIQVS